MLDVFTGAVSMRRRLGPSYWDAAILARERGFGFDAVYSKDMNPPQDQGGLRVLNPFDRPPLS